MRALFWLPFAATLPIGLLVLEANGLTATTLAAFSLPALCACAALRRRRTAAVIVTCGLAFVAARILRAPAHEVSACVGSECSGRGMPWQRVIDEREATRAGLALSGHFGVMKGEEFRTFDALIDSKWAAMPEDWRGLPNPLLMFSTASHVESLRVRAKAEGKRPCIIFLHGFGGLLSLYVHAIAEGTRGEFDVVAPALDPLGAWWSERGQAVIEATLDCLPADVDRDRVYLVGLSNGGIGATTTLLDRELTRRFAGVVLISGVGDVPELTRPPPTPVLLVSGSKDPRFPGEWVHEQFEALKRGGAEVTWATWPADHFLVLTCSKEWTGRFLAWRR
jgi:predicted esterase